MLEQLKALISEFRETANSYGTYYGLTEAQAAYYEGKELAYDAAADSLDAIVKEFENNWPANK